jgi:hypothetical protein
MALMFPKVLPKEITEDKKRSAEIKVYNALSSSLNDTFHVFYSSPWLGTNSDGSEVDGEADFLVAHPELGLVSIEVKGGRVNIDADNQWTSTDRYNIERTIKNPVEQAKKCKHQLLKALKNSRYWHSKYICAKHGVILPDVLRPNRDFRPDMPLKIFAFSEDMSDLGSWVKSRFNIENKESNPFQPLGKDGIFALEDMITRTITLHESIAVSIKSDLKDIAYKTNEQIFLIRDMEQNKRMAIAGSAGTGKTVLAITKAIQLADEGKRVLLLCFNKALAINLDKQVKKHPNIFAYNFHQFCNKVSNSAGKSNDSLDPKITSQNLIDNFTESDMTEFDALIIDEGQDFKNEWLEALELVVKDGSDGVLYVFYDDNQNVMSTSASYIDKLMPANHHLSKNFRNTQVIFKETEKYYKGGFVRAIGPAGLPLKFTELKSGNDLKQCLRNIIGYMTQQEHIAASDIVILCSDNKIIEQLNHDNKFRLARQQVTNAEEREHDKVVLDTVRRFKGLESPIVILILSADLMSSDELIYTAITRAQSHLEIIGPSYSIRKFSNVD